ncbi:MAG: ribonuclease R [Steroidobacteraceae bacterium]
MKRSRSRPRNVAETPPVRAAKPARKRVAPVADKPAAAVETDLLGQLRAAGQPLTLEQLLTLSKRSGRSAAAKLQRELEALERSGEVVRNRRDEYCLRERIGLIVGVVSGHRDGHGFVNPDDRSAPVFLSHRQMQEVLHGDRVSVRVTGHDRRGRPEGSIVDVLARGTQEMVGRLYADHGVYFVIPDNPRINHRILVPAPQLHGAQAGQIVLLKLVEQPSRHAQPVGHITRVLGDHGAPGMETDIAIHAHGLPNDFPAEVLAEAKKFGASVSAAAKRGRLDLRGLPLVTIDGEDARDFDDAVFCEKIRGGWRLLVAIADVGHYVGLNTALDAEALDRGTSVYFPNRVIPMLPEALSNGLCSLNPKVDRLCMVCEMRVSPAGKVTRAEFFEGLMRSAARLTYTEVAAFLANPNALNTEQAQSVAEPLHNLHAVFKALFIARQERHALEFDSPELKARFDEQGKIAAFVEMSRNDAHRLIEECMIAANVQAAKFLKKHKIPTLYRVHGAPEEDRLEKLREFLRGFAISLPQDRDIKPEDLSAVLKRAAESEEARLIETVVVRSMPQAVYQPQNIGHFGLALAEYAHFTSPIRRYPDLLVHRGIRHVLRGGTAEDWPEAWSNMDALGQQCSTLERRADDATRDAMSWLKCEFMQNRVGEEFDSMVTGVVEFGLFVQVKGMQIDGLIHVSSLGTDYFSRDKSGYRLVGERSGRVFRLGDHLKVRLINVVIDERKIDFELVQARGGSAIQQFGGKPGKFGSGNKFDKQQGRNPFRRRRN